MVAYNAPILAQIAVPNSGAAVCAFEPPGDFAKSTRAS